MSRGRAGRLAGALAAVIALMLAGASPAAAHTELQRSDPPNGGMVAEGRTTLTLWFDEPVGLRSSNFGLRTLEGLELPVTAVFDDGDQQVVLETPPLERGSYVLEWHAFSLTDGHASTGQVVFGAGLRPDVVATAGTGPPPLDLLVVRWLDLAAVLLAVGSVSVGGRVLEAAGPGAAVVRRRVRWVGFVAAGLACYTGLVTPFLRTRAAGTPLPDWVQQTWLTLSGSGWGQLWTVREVALVVAAGALWRWHRAAETAGRRAREVAGTALVAAAGLEALGGHAAGLPRGSVAAALMGAGHVLAAGVWVGGLAVLVAVLRRRGPDLAETSPRGAVWRTYSPRAAVASVVLLASGVYLAGHHVPGPGALTSTLYGRVVAGKTAVLAVALLFAGLNTLRVHPHLSRRVSVPGGGDVDDGRRSFARTVTAEALVLCGAILLAGVLTAVPTAREVSLATRPAVPHAVNVDGYFVTVESVPAGPDRRLVVKAQPTVLPVTFPLTGIDALLDGPGGTEKGLALTSMEEGRYEATLPAPAPGRWTATLQLHRQGRADTVVATDWQQAEPAAELANGFRLLATAVSLLLLVALAAALLLTRRRRTPPSATARPHPTLERSLS